MKTLFDYIASHVEDAELYMKADDILSVEVKQGEIKAVDGKNVLGLSLRINKDGRSGTAVSSSLEDKSILDRAILSSQYKTGDTFIFKSEKSEDVTCYDKKLVEMSSEDFIKEAQKLNERIRLLDDSITCMIGFTRTLSRVSIMNSQGLDDYYNKSLMTISLTSMSETGFVQNALSESFSHFHEISDKKLKTFIERHHISKTTYEVETRRMPVVFSGRAMGALMTRLLAGVNGEFIAKGVSPISQKLESQIASPIFSVSDDGRLANGFLTMKFDDEGTPTQTTEIVKEGLLKNFLVGVSTEDKLKSKATGNALKMTMFSKEIEDQPIINSSNFIVQPGQTDDEDIIKSIDYGIFVDSVMGTHTGNIPAGEYALNVSIGYLIKDGKFAGKVVDSMVSGNIYEDLMKIQAVGKDLELMNVVFYPMGYSPMVKFDDINVVGSK